MDQIEIRIKHKIFIRICRRRESTASSFPSSAASPSPLPVRLYFAQREGFIGAENKVRSYEEGEGIAYGSRGLRGASRRMNMLVAALKVSETLGFLFVPVLGQGYLVGLGL
ncbi:uncharacterized protein LOC105801156 [Gossypium raimondii]|uniref:uncharacterized protein LOC105801156 n=1 Tax=Gossypium raimondii TaxID=29730 RepID=UPI00227BB995|nr:uncharacterized protein LOC105801156 [Gossypium raimondii]